MMYNSYYGLSFNPFDKQQLKEKGHFVSHDFTEMTNRLNYLKDIRGIGVFTARPGMGKSFCLRCFASGLNPSLFHMEYICLSTISVADFYKQLCAILGVSDKGGNPTSMTLSASRFMKPCVSASLSITTMPDYLMMKFQSTSSISCSWQALLPPSLIPRRLLLCTALPREIPV